MRQWRGTHGRCYLLTGAFLVAFASTACARNTAQKCKPKDAACNAKAGADTNTAPAKPTSEQFPFPVEDSKGNTSSTIRTAQPDMPTSGVPDPPASSEKPMHLPPSGYSGSSSSDDAENPSPGSAGAGSSSRPADDDDVVPTTASPDAPVKSSALKDLGSRGDLSASRAKLEQTRVADDLKIGKYYLQDGNTQGAYLRYKDAAEHAPEEPDARFGLAESANKLNKHDEAVLNYREYLRLDAGGDHDKAARSALSKLGASAR